MSVKDKYSREFGVSETIGFVIILGIVMTGIAMVALYGYPALVQEQANANIKNMQKNMLVLQSDLRSLTAKGVPYQETTIQVSGGTLTISGEPDTTTPPYFSIFYDGSEKPMHPGELRFISSDGQATVVLENGAVHIRYWSSPTGSAMLSSPSWFYDSTTDTYVIHMIRMNATSDLAQTGIGTVKMQLLETTTEGPFVLTPNDYIKYTPSLESHYGTSWNNYFRNPDLNLKEDTLNSHFDFNVSSKLIIKNYDVKIISL